MDAQGFLNEMEKYAAVRSSSWQGPYARQGPELKHTPKDGNTQAADVEMTPSESSLWTRLSNSTGSVTYGNSIVRLMQKHLLENVDNLPLDQIELMAKRQN